MRCGSCVSQAWAVRASWCGDANTVDRDLWRARVWRGWRSRGGRRVFFGGEYVRGFDGRHDGHDHGHLHDYVYVYDYLHDHDGGRELDGAWGFLDFDG